MKRRRGSLMLVLTYGTLMAFVVLGMMTLSLDLYKTSQDSAEIYADLQTYRAVTELATYQYVTDLCAVTVTKDFDADWISISGNAVYSQALSVIKDSLASNEDGDLWYNTEAAAALGAANIDKPEVLTNILEKLSGKNQSFMLCVPGPLEVDTTNPDNRLNRHGGALVLEPICIVVDLSVRGQKVHEEFEVTGLVLQVMLFEEEVAGVKHEKATMYLQEAMGGVKISRVY